MRIAIMTDFHFGVKWGTPREWDSFEQAEEAIRRAIAEKADVILILGDIFDTRIPKLEVWAQALKVLSIPQTDGKNRLNLVSSQYKPLEAVSPLALQGTPVVAICGNHERRTRGLKNPVEALESAGKLIYLEAGTVVFQEGGEKVAIHGFGYVPERYLIPQLRTWNPQPVPGAFNIFAFHQSIGNFVYSEEEKPAFQISDLPPGFDLYANGHVHARAEAQAHGAPLLLPGSTERTQLIEDEAVNPKGFYLAEIKDGNLSYRFIELQSPRDFFYERVRVENISLQDLYGVVRRRIRELLLRHRRNQKKPPIIRIKLEGTLAKDVLRSDFDARLVEEEFREQAIVTIGKGDLVSPGMEARLRSLREFKERELSIDEKGLLMLEELAKEIPNIGLVSVRDLFGLMAEDRKEEALAKLLKIVEGMVEAEVGG